MVSLWVGSIYSLIFTANHERPHIEDIKLLNRGLFIKKSFGKRSARPSNWLLFISKKQLEEKIYYWNYIKVFEFSTFVQKESMHLEQMVDPWGQVDNSKLLKI